MNDTVEVCKVKGTNRIVAIKPVGSIWSDRERESELLEVVVVKLDMKTEESWLRGDPCKVMGKTKLKAAKS